MGLYGLKEKNSFITYIPIFLFLPLFNIIIFLNSLLTNHNIYLQIVYCSTYTDHSNSIYPLLLYDLTCSYFSLINYGL